MVVSDSRTVAGAPKLTREEGVRDKSAQVRGHMLE